MGSRDAGKVGQLLMGQPALAAQGEHGLVEGGTHVFRPGTDAGKHGLQFERLRPVQHQQFADRGQLLLVRHDFPVQHLGHRRTGNLQFGGEIILANLRIAQIVANQFSEFRFQRCYCHKYPH